MKQTVVAALLIVIAGTCAAQTTVDLVEQSLDLLCAWIQANYTRQSVDDECDHPASGCEFNTSSAVCATGYGNVDECGCQNTSFVDFNLVNLMASSAARASSKFNEAACRTLGFEDAVAAARAKAPGLTNIYAGFPSGITRVWPAYNWARTESTTTPGCYAAGYCPDYDPRRRPWFGLAAAGPLDVVVLVDASATMNEQYRLAKAKGATKAILGSLASGLSFAQVVSFGSAGKVVMKERAELVRCNDTGVSALQAFTEAIEAEATTTGTAIVAAFEAAYELLRTSRAKTPPVSSSCRTAIVCLSASADTALAARIAELADSWNATDEAVNAPRIFMYSYAADETVEDSHKNIACENDGLWKPMDDALSDHSNVALGFIEYFSAGNMLFTPRWAPPYYDASGLGMVITASKACRWEMTVPPKLLAVVASDFVLTENPMFTPGLIANLTAAGAQCGPFQLNEYDVEQLRGSAHRCNPGLNNIVVGVSFAIAIVVIILTSLVLFCTTRVGSRRPPEASMDPVANEHGR